MAVHWEEDDLGSMGYREGKHVVTIALGENEVPDGVVMLRPLAAPNRWYWSAWRGSVRLGAGTSDSRETAKLQALRVRRYS